MHWYHERNKKNRYLVDLFLLMFLMILLHLLMFLLIFMINTVFELVT